MMADPQFNKIEQQPSPPPVPPPNILEFTSKSPFNENYTQLMHNYEKKIDETYLEQKLRQFNIQTQAKATQDQIDIIQIKTTRYNEILDVTVKVNKYIIKIRNSPVHSKGCLDQGTYGKVYKYQPLDQIPRVVKCIPIPSESTIQEQILSVIIEYSYLTLAAALGAGPKTQQQSFNIYVYKPLKDVKQQTQQQQKDQGCIEFEMEYLQRNGIMNQQQQKSLMERLYLMHRMGMTHNDIKTSNILFSQIQTKWMFIDFGVSSFQKQGIGYESQTTFKGTYQYCGPQMTSLYPDKIGNVDLYWNDCIGIQKSIAKIKELKPVILNPLRLYVNDNEISTHYLMLKLKYHIHNYNMEMIKHTVSQIVWNTALKKTLLYFLAQINYFPQELKQYLRNISWQDVSQFEIVNTQLIFGQFNSTFHLRSLIGNIQSLQQRKKNFQGIYHTLLMLKSKEQKNKYLKKIVLKKQRRKIIQMLCRPKTVFLLDKQTYYPLIFNVMNYLRSKQNLSNSKRIKICLCFKKYQTNHTMKGDESANIQMQKQQGSFSDVLNFFKQILQLAFAETSNILRSYIIEIYINYIMLGQGDTALINQMYNCLPTLSEDPYQLCNIFYIIYCNNFWFEKTVNHKNQLDYHSIKRQIMNCMKIILSKLTIKVQYQQHTNCHICLQKEKQMAKVIQMNSKFAKITFTDKISSIKSVINHFQFNLSMRVKNEIKNMKSMKNMKSYKDSNEQKYEAFRYIQWQLPLNTAEIFSKQIYFINSTILCEAYFHLLQIFKCPQICKFWYPSLFINYLADSEDFHKQIIKLYASNNRNSKNNIYYMTSFYHFRRYIFEHVQHFYNGVQKRDSLRQIFLVIGDSFDEQVLARLMITLNIQETLGFWWYLREAKKEDHQKINRILRIMNQQIQKQQCGLKKKIKALEIMIFTSIHSLKVQPCQDSIDIIDKQVFQQLDHSVAKFMKLRYIENRLSIMMKPRTGYYMSKQFDLLCQQLQKLITTKQQIYQVAILRTARTLLLSCYIIYLLKYDRIDETISLIQTIYEKVFSLLSKQTSLMMLRLKSFIYNFYVDNLQHFRRWPKIRYLYFPQKASRSLRLIQIFLVYTQLIICRHFKQNYPHSLPNSKLKPILYKSLLLHDKIDKESNYQDIELFYRCICMMERNQKFIQNFRYYTYLGRKHKKIIERILSSEDIINQSQRLPQLYFYAEKYVLFLKRPKYYPFIDEISYRLSLFKLKLTKMYKMQSNYNIMSVFMAHPSEKLQI